MTQMTRTVSASPTDIGSEFDGAKAQIRLAVENVLSTVLTKQAETEVARAAAYAVLGGGHRWRAIAAVVAGRIFSDDYIARTISAACGVELAHAASLILDDLPSMDDALLRRGKPCAHRVFAPWAVDMAPVFMVTLAYQVSLDNPSVAAEQRVKAALILSQAGLAMIEGQCHDILPCGTPDNAEEWLIERYRLKSAALYGSAMFMGGVLCGADDAEAERLYTAGVELGLAYQFQDDVADVTAGVAEVGKEAGMDAHKLTAIDLFGIEGARARGDAYQQRAVSKLEGFGSRADFLLRLVTEASWKAY